MDTGRERVRAVFQGKAVSPPCCGEVWLGGELFSADQLEDNLVGHFQRCRELGMDIVSLPVNESLPSSESTLYRYFLPEDIFQIAANFSFAVTVIIDGPFQRLANEMGLLSLLTLVKRDAVTITRRLSTEANTVKGLIDACARAEVAAVVLADDIAYGQSTYLSRDDIRQFLLPHYAQFNLRVHRGDRYTLFHSDGNLTNLIPDLVTIGFDGLAGVQGECVDLVSLKRQWGQQLTIWGGLDHEILDTETLTPAQRDRFLTVVSSLAHGGKFILGSSSGLYSGKHLESIKSIYKLVRGALVLEP